MTFRRALHSNSSWFINALTNFKLNLKRIKKIHLRVFDYHLFRIWVKFYVQFEFTIAQHIHTQLANSVQRNANEKKRSKKEAMQIIYFNFMPIRNDTQHTCALCCVWGKCGVVWRRIQNELCERYAAVMLSDGTLHCRKVRKQCIHTAAFTKCTTEPCIFHEFC